MRTFSKQKIVEALIQSGFISEKELEPILAEAIKQREVSLIKLLSDSNIMSEIDLLTVLSKEMDIPPIDILNVRLNPKLMEIVSERLIRRHCILPLSKIGDEITIVAADPSDIFAIDDVRTVTGCDVEIVLAARNAINDAINVFYSKDEEELSTIMEEARESGDDVEVMGEKEGIDITGIAEESKAAPIVKMVDLIIGEAIEKKASDIHIEPQEKSLRIRYRIDGQLYNAFDLPKKNQNAILARLKIMSNLDITETRVPQDGRFRIRLGEKEIDFRVSSLPLNYGNKMVLRALDKANLSVGLETLGFLPEPLADFKEALSRPFGIILVTGPTGSGKSTTLYSILNSMNVPGRNIVTVEDPVEYQVQGITQIAARPEIGLDFASGLRAILRQSPDTILVGEIRDFETADIAIKASLTGQMVLSTLHTNNAVGAITRLVNMGIEPFLVASSLVMACAQRLLRKICSNCKAEEDIPADVLKKIRSKYSEAVGVNKFYHGTGCEQCHNTGYKGRLGTLETLLIDDEIKEMIIARKSEEDINVYLKKQGAMTLRDNAMRKFIRGWTSLEEVYRVT
ncbi:MAG: GspE/PulE family protein [Candidatus Omnitrophota bacterium]